MRRRAQEDEAPAEEIYPWESWKGWEPQRLEVLPTDSSDRDPKRGKVPLRCMLDPPALPGDGIGGSVTIGGGHAFTSHESRMESLGSKAGSSKRERREKWGVEPAASDKSVEKRSDGELDFLDVFFNHDSETWSVKAAASDESVEEFDLF